MNSPASVLRAKDHATVLAGQMGPSSPSLSHHAGTVLPGASASLLSSDLDALTDDIQQAYNDFASERSLFGNAAAGIETHLSAALLFARANAAVALKTGSTASVAMHLNRIVSHLAMTEDLMLFGSISAMTADQAVAARARIDLVIASATTGYDQQSLGLLAPSSLGSIYGGAEQPLCDQASLASSYATGPLPFELGGVSVIVGGQAAQLVYVSSSRLAFVVPSDVSLGSAEVIVTSQDGYVSRGTTTISRSVLRIMTSEDGTGRAMAMNLTKQTADFDVTTTENLGADKRTRVSLFALGISASAANNDTGNDILVAGNRLPNFAESVVVEGRLTNGQLVSLPVEFAGSQPGLIGLDQVTLRLAPELRGAGTVALTLIVGGQRSNAGTIVIR
jgi:uncharacterized protein (TIGR03437 family)